MEALQLIQLTLEELESRMEAASERGATKALSGWHQQQAANVDLSTEDAMELAGYSDPAFFRDFLKRNRIFPVEKPGRRKWYRRDDIVNCRYPKGVHIK